MAQGADPTPLPRFDGIQTGQGPRTVQDWVQFWQFLLSLWRKAQASATIPQAKALIPPNASSTAGTIQAAVAVSQARVQASIVARQVAPQANIALAHPTKPAPPDRKNEDPLAIALAMGIRPPYPSRVQALSPNQYGAVFEGTRDERNSYGAGNIAGSTLTASSGPAFTPSYVGKQIAINGALFLVTGYTSGTVITLTGGPPAGACGWQFMLYPANSVPNQSLYCETNSKLLYLVRDSFGTVNTNGTTVTWVSGPKFSPYWGGLQITINGVAYTVSFTTQTTMTIASSAGIQTGVSYAVLQSNWFYECGIEFLSSATLISRYSGSLYDVTDDGYTASVFDYNHTLNYNGSSNLWAWGMGDPGSKWIAASGDGSVPQGGPWQFCDGTNVGTFQIVAGVPQIVNVTTPDLRADTFIRGGTFTGTPDASTAPSFAVGSLTVSTESATHTHSFSAAATSTETASHTHGVSAVTVSTESATHTHSLTSGGTGNESIVHTHGFGPTTNAQPYASGTAVVVPLSLGNESVFHQHPLTGSSGSESATHSHTLGNVTDGESATHTHLFTASSSTESATHTHTISGSATIGAPTVGAGAPKSMALLFYMRR